MTIKWLFPLMAVCMCGFFETGDAIFNKRSREKPRTKSNKPGANSDNLPPEDPSFMELFGINGGLAKGAVEVADWNMRFIRKDGVHFVDPSYSAAASSVMGLASAGTTALIIGGSAAALTLYVPALTVTSTIGLSYFYGTMAVASVWSGLSVMYTHWDSDIEFRQKYNDEIKELFRQRDANLTESLEEFIRFQYSEEYTEENKKKIDKYIDVIENSRKIYRHNPWLLSASIFFTRFTLEPFVDTSKPVEMLPAPNRTLFRESEQDLVRMGIRREYPKEREDLFKITSMHIKILENVLLLNNIYNIFLNGIPCIIGLYFVYSYFSNIFRKQHIDSSLTYDLPRITAPMIDSSSPQESPELFASPNDFIISMWNDNDMIEFAIANIDEIEDIEEQKTALKLLLSSDVWDNLKDDIGGPKDKIDQLIREKRRLLNGKYLVDSLSESKRQRLNIRHTMTRRKMKKSVSRSTKSEKRKASIRASTSVARNAAIRATRKMSSSL